MSSLTEFATSALFVWSAATGRVVTPADTVPAMLDTVPIESTAIASRPAALTSSITFGRAHIASTGLGLLDASQPDTVRKPRRKAFVYSDGYSRRLTLHRWLSWGMIPLFAASYFSGSELLNASADGRQAKQWARSLHGPSATGSAILFGANTVTGSINLWQGRADPNGRTRRIIHSVLFMAASGGFVYAGTKLADDAEQSQDKRIQHRNVALASMGVSTVSWLIMLVGN